MVDFGKIIIFLGVGLVVLGLALMVIGRSHLQIGRLPGDFLYRGKNTTVYFPLATSLLVSLVLSILLYVVGKWRR
jgi:ABC-type Na+ efflux pump permease subunit